MTKRNSKISCDDTFENGRWYMARNTATPPAVLAKLAEDTDANVRSGVARNPNTPPSTLVKLAASDKDYDVRRSVASNPNTPPAVRASFIRRQPIRDYPFDGSRG